ncbi:MAG: peptidoglycan recognition family protein [Candidatus Didemnitutus sp.]|nr:peptidoglycan recognition family protein [Candidatus Didemnitutus sp.]
MFSPRFFSTLGVFVAFALLSGCATPPAAPLSRQGEEIVVAGQFFPIGTPVVTWMDPGGYDAYRVERRFAPLAESGWDKTAAARPDIKSPNRYGLRAVNLSNEEISRVRGGGWDLPLLRRVVDQFVLHYDACGISKQCFNILHDHRGLSVHFMLDLDGTIYQTLDVKERAWHASTSNDRSVGVEIANIGAYAPGDLSVLQSWYRRDAKGGTEITIPEKLGDPLFRVKGFKGRPIRPEPVKGNIQATDLVQYDLTPEQYAALIKLTAALSKIFPKIKLDYPRDAKSRLITHKLPDAQLAAFQGVIGHYHIQTNKTDPGPALQWDKIINGARALRK